VQRDPRLPASASHDGSLLAAAKRLFALLRRVSDLADSHDADIVAAGLAFYGLLGLFPSLLAIVSVYGLVADPAEVEGALSSLAHALPAQARVLVVGGLAEFVERPSDSLGFRLAFGLLAALWSSSSAMAVLVRAINVAYGLPEHRSFFARRRIAVAFTLGGVASVAVVVPLLTALPKLLHLVRADLLTLFVPWVVLAVAAFLALLVLFRYAPYRRGRSFRAAMPGAMAASLVWLLMSTVYSLYVRYVAQFTSTYGALEGVIVLELWLYVSALVLLYGAELNAELEARRQVDHDAHAVV
jgi:membrane protein